MSTLPSTVYLGPIKKHFRNGHMDALHCDTVQGIVDKINYYKLSVYPPAVITLDQNILIAVTNESEILLYMCVNHLVKVWLFSELTGT